MILIAVALFAALGFAVTQNSSSLSGAADKEEARIAAQEMIQFGNGLRSVIDQMLLLDGVSEVNSGSNGLLFQASGAHADYGVVGAQPKTEIFHPSGGKMTYQIPPRDACSSCAFEFTGQITITGVKSNSKAELAMVVPGISREVCEKINHIQENNWSTTPTEDALTLLRFDGVNYSDLGGGNAITLTGGANEFVGKRGFCYQESAGGARYIFVQVLRAR